MHRHRFEDLVSGDRNGELMGPRLGFKIRKANGDDHGAKSAEAVFLEPMEYALA